MKIQKLSPAFKDYLWGGTRLRDVYGKQCAFDKVAESWELSTHPAGQSVIDGGEYDGLPLGEYFEKAGKEVLGTDCEDFPEFPVLIKFIDAKDPLSVQVHPSDEYALREEGEYGKTEMWIVIDSDPGAFLYFGVSRPVTGEEFRQSIGDNTVTELLNRVEVHPGDVFFIEAGTLHAIGGGILICEIQQNSNLTYRVYDYDRRGADGKPRELHVEKALKVASLTPSPVSAPREEERTVNGGRIRRLACCRYFTVEQVEVETAVALEAGKESFVSLTVTRGSVTVTGPENAVHCTAGDSLFLPAGLGSFTVSGAGTVIKTTV